MTVWGPLEVPDEAARREILTGRRDIWRWRMMSTSTTSREIVMVSSGRILAQLCTEAVLLCVRGALRDAESNAPSRKACSMRTAGGLLGGDAGAVGPGPDHLKVSKAHFTKAAKACNPLFLARVGRRGARRWADVGGLENVKTELKETVEYHRPVRRRI